MNELLPYKIEYSEGDRDCERCKKRISQRALRIAILVPSNEGSFQRPEWYHSNCFFKIRRPATQTEFSGFEYLRIHDQNAIKIQLGGHDNESKNMVKMTSVKVEYVKTNQESCAECQRNIAKGKMRFEAVSNDENENVNSKLYHVGCFDRLRSKLKWLNLAESIIGFQKLTDEDKEFIKKRFSVIKSNSASKCGLKRVDIVPNAIARNNSQPLRNMEFMAIESWAKRKEIERIVERMGGKVVSRIHRKLAAVISNQETLEKMGRIIVIAKSYNIQVVSENFLIEAQHSDPLWYIKNYSLSKWGGDPYARIESNKKLADIKSPPPTAAIHQSKDQNGTNGKSRRNENGIVPWREESTMNKKANNLKTVNQHDSDDKPDPDSKDQNNDTTSELQLLLTTAHTSSDGVMNRIEGLNVFCNHYKNVKESEINGDNSESLCSYFGGLNDVLTQFKTMLDELDVKHSGIKVMRENVENLNRYLETAKVLIETKKFSEAVEIYTTALDMKLLNTMSTFELLFERAFANSKTGNFRNAIDDCTKALSINSAHINCKLLRAQCYYYLENFEACIRDYESVQSSTEIQENTERLDEVSSKLESVRNEMQRKLAEDKNSTGKRLVSSLKYHAAKKFFSEAIELWPDNVIYYQNRLNCLIRMGEYKRALQDCQRIISINPNCGFAYERQAKCCLILGDYDGAERANKKLEEHPTYVTVCNKYKDLCVRLRQSENVANQNYQSQRFSLAVHAINRGLNILPESVHLKLLKAEYCMHLGQLEEIRKLEVVPDIAYADRCYLKCLCFNHQGNLKQALSQLSKGLEDDSSHDRCKLMQTKLKNIIKKKTNGDDLFAEQKYREAVASYTEVLENISFKNEFVFKILNSRASAQLNLLEHDLALSDCIKALNIKPNHIDTLLIRAECYQSIDNFDGAIKDYKSALSNGRINSQQMDDIQSKIKMAQRHKDASEKKRAGDEKFALNNMPFALKDYDDAIALWPENVSYYDKQAACYVRMGNYNKAIEIYKLALTINSSHCEGHYGLIKMYIALGDVFSAERTIQNSFEFVPKNDYVINKYKRECTDLKALEEKAMECYNKKDFSSALSKIDLALKSAHRSLKFKLLKGECLALLERYEEAEQIAIVCQMSDPKNADVVYIRALCWYHKNWQEGIKHLKNVILLDPDHKKAKSLLRNVKNFGEKEKLANEIFQREQYREAIGEFAEALEMCPKDNKLIANLLYNRGSANLKIGLLRDAIKDCTKAMSTDQSIYAKALRIRAQSYKHMRNFSKCVNDYEELVRLENTTMDRTMLIDAKMNLAKSRSNNYYDILDIPKTATAPDIKKAYRKLSLIHHPDKHADASEQEKHEQQEIFKKINVAYETLSKPTKKMYYDQEN
ncbi:uncharacterized protein LOC129567771 [Sitodiplosis mosellana]|uniref:uncharacterized protein LOC129567771 n=1 Tax=Sitodiplosis mosellana TaxID=263140 RepID=UPI00244411EB|nr:uncharacterized protein LOC129567771 [Sitodiplosis mosellana]